MKTIIALLAGLYIGGMSGYYAGMLEQPVTLQDLSSRLDVTQQRLEARVTGLMHYCVKGSALQVHKHGCEELRQYVTTEASKGE